MEGGIISCPECCSFDRSGRGKFLVGRKLPLDGWMGCGYLSVSDDFDVMGLLSVYVVIGRVASVARESDSCADVERHGAIRFGDVFLSWCSRVRCEGSCDFADGTFYRSRYSTAVPSYTSTVPQCVRRDTTPISYVGRGACFRCCKVRAHSVEVNLDLGESSRLTKAKPEPEPSKPAPGGACPAGRAFGSTVVFVLFFSSSVDEPMNSGMMASTSQSPLRKTLQT